MGLYCKISIVSFYILIIGMIFSLKIFQRKNKYHKKVFKLISIRRYKRYIKLVFTKKAIIYIVFFSIISNSIVLIQNNKYQELYKDLNQRQINISGTIVQKDSKKYTLKVNDNKYKNTYLYIYPNNKERKEIKLGDEIYAKGIFQLPKGKSNYKGFDYSSYLKSKKIYGIMKNVKIEIKTNNNLNIFIRLMNKLKIAIEEKIENMEFNKEEKDIVKALILGEKDEISEEIIQDFSNSNLIHLLAISGMHISYIIVLTNFVFNKIIGKHYAKVITSLFILIYIFLTGCSSSILRAGITGIILIMSNFFYKKNDIWESLGLALIIILVYNPYMSQNVGLQLSVMSVLGIICEKNILKKSIMQTLEIEKKIALRKNQKIKKIIIKIINSPICNILIESFLITISVTITITPILAMNFNKINFTNLMISLYTGIIIGPIMCVGIISILIDIKFVQFILSLLLKALLISAKFSSYLPLSQIWIGAPNLFQIIIYYFFVVFFLIYLKINITKINTPLQKRIKNLINLVKYRIRQNMRKMICCIIIVSFIVIGFKIYPQDMKIYFIDVMQRR